MLYIIYTLTYVLPTFVLLFLIAFEYFYGSMLRSLRCLALYKKRTKA